MKGLLSKLATLSLFCIFLVVVAGSIVRMTGSGMGCPDWPKCFGYYIPPTDVETLTWKTEREFQKGNIIIRNEALWVANTDFISGAEFSESNWSLYTKHDYAKFNAAHTWTEFVNRLIGAFAGIPVFILFVCSLIYFKKDPIITITAFLGLVLLGFEAWLGKEVVDGNLIPNQITYHMLGALILVAIFTFIKVRLLPMELSFQTRRDRRIVIWGVVALSLLFIQIVLGTQVREMVDEIGREALLETDDWIGELGVKFLIHRSFSIVVLVVMWVFAVKLIRTRNISTWPRILILFLIGEILFGIGLAYLEMPKILQPLHLLFSFLMFALGFGLVLNYRQRTTIS